MNFSKSLGKRGLTLVPLIVLLTVWHFTTVHQERMEFFLGSPRLFVHEAVRLAASGELFTDTFTTLAEAFLGFGIGNVAGAALGLWLWQWPLMFRVLKPYFMFLGSVPIFAIAPLVVIWFGTGWPAKIAVTTASTFFLAVAQAYRGALQADQEYLDLVTSFGGERQDEFWKVVVPSSISWVGSALQINAGQAITGAVIAEYLSSERGLGHLAVVAGGLYNTSLLLLTATLMWVVASILAWLARVLEGLLRSQVLARL